MWKNILPKVWGYRIETVHGVSEIDGSEVVKYVKVPVGRGEKEL
jgi:hypothetical protein